MFNVFSKSDDYRTQCAKLFNKHSGIDTLVILAYINDFNGIFEAIEKETKEPNIILINAGNLILKSIINNTVNEIKEGNKCRMYEQITLKINYWSLEILNNDDKLKESILDNIQNYKELFS